MILIATFASTVTPSALADCGSLVSAVAAAGFDAAFFVREAGAALDAVPLIAALASLDTGIGLGASVPIGYSQPFHLARAYAAIDRLTRGRSAMVIDPADDLAPAIGRPLTGGSVRTLEFFEATTALWDSWEDDAVLVDRPAGLFTNPDKIHRINHDGAFYTVRGPLNAPRPLQGWPVIVAPAAVPAEVAARYADVVLVPGTTARAVRDAGKTVCALAAACGRSDRAIRILADIEWLPDAPALMRDWHAAGVCDGFNIRLDRTTLARLPGRPPRPDGITLRARLGLPRPPSRYAA
jgi:alkanesulfonate monooxygenase SsuD/methylene tetrahydromethanopterin reductase-like flavin-dependent oxidoreductase (luciferase family)